MYVIGRHLAVTCLGCAVVSAASAAAETPVPTRLAQARFVALGFDLGDRFVTEQEAHGDLERIPPEDRQTLAGLRVLFEEWGHYSLTDRPEDAELVVVMRSGHRLLGNLGIHVGGLGEGRSRVDPRYGGELATGSDMLSVYEADVAGRPETLLWRQARDGGLNGTPPPLFEALKGDVEKVAMRRPSGPQLSLTVQPAEDRPAVRPGDAAVAHIGFGGYGWGDQPLRWDLYLGEQRVSCASVPIPGATASGRQIDVEWTLTEDDCARIVKDVAGGKPARAHAPVEVSLAAHVRRIADDKTLQSASTIFRVACGREP